MRNSTKSTPATKVIEANPFPNALDLCKIIGACREAGVSRLRVGQMDISFGPEAEILAPAVPTVSVTTPAEKVPEEIIRAQKRAETASLEEQEITLREQQVAELLISDPLAAEELMAQGELEPSGEQDGSSAGVDE